MTDEVAAAWDAEAVRYDEEPDHGLRDPATREAWRAVLREHLPPAPARVADLGCGTGSLAVLLAEDGYAVHAHDASPEMLRRAAAKAESAGVTVDFTRGDASSPPYPLGSYDVVLCRHVLWALPDPHAALARWTQLLAPGGRLVLVEGHWSTGAGLSAQQSAALVRRHRASVEVRPLTDPVLWGGPLDDERYVLVSTS